MIDYEKSMTNKEQYRPIKRLLSVSEAATYLGRTEGAFRELVYKGLIPAVKIDRRVQVDIHDLDKLIENSKTKENIF